MRNYGMNENFADVNPERDFQTFNDEKNSHLQTNISQSKTMLNQKKIRIWSGFEPALLQGNQDCRLSHLRYSAIMQIEASLTKITKTYVMFH